MFQDIKVSEILIRIPVLLLALSVHEFAHGFAAYCLGDSTAKRDGRLSLNPLRHIDPLGFLCMLVFRFGWAKPVMVGANNFKSPKYDMAITALAGPLSNFLLGFVAIFACYPLIQHYTDTGIMFYVISFFVELCQMNIILGIFNMIPFPPLDGSKVFGVLLPNTAYFRFISGGRFGMIILLVLIYTNAFSRWLSPAIQGMFEFYWAVAEKVYSFL